MSLLVLLLPLVNDLAQIAGRAKALAVSIGILAIAAIVVFLCAGYFAKKRNDKVIVTIFTGLLLVAVINHYADVSAAFGNTVTLLTH